MTPRVSSFFPRNVFCGGLGFPICIFPQYTGVEPFRVQLADPLPTGSAFYSASTENSRSVVQKLRLPAGNLVSMHVIMRSKLRDRLLAFQGFHSHFRLEGRRVVASRPFHRNYSCYCGKI